MLGLTGIEEMLQKLQMFNIAKKKNSAIGKKHFFGGIKLADINNKRYLCSFIQQR